MSEHLRAQWRRTWESARSRGLDYSSAWSANEPEFWIVGNAAPVIGGDWEGHTVLARETMSYADAMNPSAFVNNLMSVAQQRIRSDEYLRDRGITTLYLVARGRGKDGLNAGGVVWVVGQADVRGGQFQPTSVTLRGSYGKVAVPSPRLMHAMMYSQGEEARKWIGENLAGVVTDESMFEDLAQTVTVYRGVSLGPHADPWSSVNDDGGVGHSWTVSLNTAKAIAERGRAGFSSGAQVLGDTYSIDFTSDRTRNNYLPTVLRAEVTLMPPEQHGPSPYRPWTIDYASEAEIDIPRGTEIVLNGFTQAAPVRHGPNPGWEGEELVTWRWSSSWQRGNVRRTTMRATAAWLSGESYWGAAGDRSHITRNEKGMIPTSAIATMPGVCGERPGEHRNKHGREWTDFVADIRTNGIRSPIFIVVDPGKGPAIAEGNHRRDAAVEAGLTEVPVNIRYFGKSEDDTLVAPQVSRDLHHPAPAGWDGEVAR